MSRCTRGRFSLNATNLWLIRIFSLISQTIFRMYACYADTQNREAQGSSGKFRGRVEEKPCNKEIVNKIHLPRCPNEPVPPPFIILHTNSNSINN